MAINHCDSTIRVEEAFDLLPSGSINVSHNISKISFIRLNFWYIHKRKKIKLQKVCLKIERFILFPAKIIHHLSILSIRQLLVKNYRCFKTIYDINTSYELAFSMKFKLRLKFNFAYFLVKLIINLDNKWLTSFRKKYFLLYPRTSKKK